MMELNAGSIGIVYRISVHMNFVIPPKTSGQFHYIPALPAMPMVIVHHKRQIQSTA
jgi:hypothetical protein